jgi:Tfp pilus assembly protein FimT
MRARNPFPPPAFRRGHRRQARASGLTLAELCFALALLSVLAGLTAPGLRASLRTAAVRSAALELMAGLHRLRAHSILEGRPGSWCLSGGNGLCLPASATALAWEAYLDSPVRRETVGGGDLPRDVVIRANRSPLRFWPHARAASTGTLTICDTQAVAAPRAIVISQSGRARMTNAPPDACAG